MKKRPTKLVCTILSSALLLGVAQSVFAAEAAEQEYSLDEYVVTANRTPVKVTEVAANVTVITREEIEKGGFTSVPDILSKSNVNLEKSSVAAVPLLNGDDRVLILVDGRRMHWEHLVVSGSDHAGVNLDQFPVKNIERIEIVRGPASSLYGSDAVGGVINIITRKADSSLTAISSEFGSWGFRRYSLTTEGKTSDISYLVTAETKERDNFKYKDATTGQTKTYADSQENQQFLTMRLDKELTDGRSLSLQVEHTENESGYNGYLNADGASYYPGGYRTGEDNNVALTYHWGQQTGSDNSLRIYRNESELEHHNSLVKSDGVSPYTYDLAATGIDWQQSWRLSKKHTLVGGADWRQEQLNDEDSIDQSFNTGAIFIEDRWRLPSNWTLSAGTRYDDHSVVGGHATSRVTANREINPTTNVYTSWGQYVKNPTIAQLYSNTQWWKGNPDLSPETGETTTIGMNTELSAGTKLQASIYHSHINDAIDWAWKDWDGTGTSYTKYINVDNEKRQGLDVSLSRQLSPQWNVSTGYTYVKIQNKTASDTAYSADLRNSQPNGYRLNVQYDQDKWDAGLTLRSATGRSLEKFTSESYLTLDMNANYQFNPDTRVYFKGYNLTNEAYELVGYYWSHAGEFPMPARSFYVGFEQKL